MQYVTVPLFTEKMIVECYLLRYQETSGFFQNLHMDGGLNSKALDIANEFGLSVLALDKPLVIPIKFSMLLGNLEEQCKVEPSSVILFFENDDLQIGEIYIQRLKALRELGFRFAFRFIKNHGMYSAILRLCDYVFLAQNGDSGLLSGMFLLDIQRNYRNLTPVATNVFTHELFESAVRRGYHLFENRYAKISSAARSNSMSPLKVNTLRLLSLTQSEDFEFSQIARIVERDPALTISLLKIANLQTRNEIKTIDHAVTMLGQQEVRKWAATAVTRTLGDDKPDEVTRVSLIRAKFGESLAKLFSMPQRQGEIYLAGLFSMLDVMLGMDMEKALDMVKVSGDIRDTLLKTTSDLYPVYSLVLNYEEADWPCVSRLCIVNDIDEDEVSQAYVETLVWYQKLITA